MFVKFWGTRGSIATPGPSTARYGGNTSCTELRTDDGTLLVLDCGTGARELGLRLLRERPVKAHILVTHTHWDHIQGFPFFTPAFLPDSEITIYAPTGFALNLSHALAGQMQYSYFPVKLDDLRSRLTLVDVEEGTFNIGSVTVETQFLNHTAPTIGYRISSGGATVVYATDHEPYTVPSGSLVHPGDQRHTAFLDGADLVIHDAQYTEDEYPTRLGWGHSTVTYAADVAMEAGAKRLALYHHEPAHDDATIERLEAATQAHALSHRSSLEVFAAAEGAELYLPERPNATVPVNARSALDQRPVLGARVLFVSNNPSHTGAVTEVLDQEGMETVIVTDEEQLFEMVQRDHPHAVVLDGQFLDQRVFSLASALSSNFDALDTAIILLSPSLDDDTVRRAHAAGVTDCLAIPFSPPMLFARLKAWLTRYYRPDRSRTAGRQRRRPGTLPIPPPPPEGSRLPAEARVSRKTALLAATHLFGGLSEEEMRRLSRQAKQGLYEAGETIAQQGAVGGVLFLIVSGRVRVVGRPPDVQAGEVLLDEFGPGDVFGELSSLDDLPHSATVQAVTKTRCLLIQRKDLLGIMERSPSFSLRLLRTLTQRLRQADRILVRGGPDALTGLSTRQTVEEHYKREAAAARRRGYPLTLVVVDVDDLKGINNGHGHVVGDEVLRAMADALRASTRDSDIVGRLGGDNFVAILPDAGGDGAPLVAERITRGLAGLAEHRKLPTTVTCSIRMVASQKPPSALDEWLVELERRPEVWGQRGTVG